MDERITSLLYDHNMLMVLRHFHIAKVDYAKNIMRYTEIPKTRVQEYLKKLESMGLIEKYTNTSIKRTEAKLKKSAEVHKHHTYFQLTKDGSTVLKSITPKLYFSALEKECIMMINNSKIRSTDDQKCRKMVEMGLLGHDLSLTSLGSEVLERARKTGALRGLA